jgi:hypothetical protein
MCNGGCFLGGSLCYTCSNLIRPTSMHTHIEYNVPTHMRGPPSTYTILTLTMIKHIKSQSYYKYRVQSSVWRLPNY